LSDEAPPSLEEERPLSAAAAAYDRIAASYDLLTAGYPYDQWIDSLERLAVEHGLAGRRLLDVACGTGHSMLPWLERGYQVTGVDISARMAAVARAKVAGRAAVHVADMRALPDLGQFDLVTCLGDALNHLLEPADVRAALDCMSAQLAPSGLVIFDLNLLAAYRDLEDVIAEDAERVVLWPGACARVTAPGGVAELVIDVFEREGQLWRRIHSCQPHRHHPLGDVLDWVAGAGLHVAAVFGQQPGVRLDWPADEGVHAKAIVLAAAT
jgi:SAM-dependent methyltransferase